MHFLSDPTNAQHINELLATPLDAYFVKAWVSFLDNNSTTQDHDLGYSVLPSDTVDLIHTSPPYNIEKRYADSSDDLEHSEYIQLLVDVFSECYRILRPGASLFLQTGYSQDVSVEMFPIDMLSYGAMRNMGYRLWDRIIWYYRGGMSFTRKFENTHETILWWVGVAPL